MSAAFLGPTSSLPIVEPSCSTGNCTWPNYESLGICIELQNVTDPLNKLQLASYTQDLLRQYYGIYPVGLPVYPAVMIPGTSPSNLFNQSVTQAAILELWISFSSSMVTLSANTTDFSTFEFYAVAFFLCTKIYSTNVTSGQAYVAEISSTLDLISSPAHVLNFWWNESLLYFNDTCIPELSGDSLVLGGLAGPTSIRYPVDVCTAILFSDFLGLTLSSGIFLTSDLLTVFEYGQMASALGVTLFGNYLSTSTYDSAVQFENAQRLLGNIAGSLTNLYVGADSIPARRFL